MKLIFISMMLSMFATPAAAEQRLRLATTTSTENAGLLAVLHPPFERQMDVRLDVIATGSGRALKLGEQGDVDVVLVHAPAAEKRFIATGHGVQRLAVMRNDFVLLGPPVDPAKVRRTASITAALQAVAARQADFISRGDDSGTHKKEQALWRQAGLAPDGRWYLAVGQGMGAALRMADDKQAYTLADRGTYLAFKDNLSLQILSQGGPDLANPYHVIMVNPERHPQVQRELAQAYIDFIRGQVGQGIIRNFTRAGEPLFIPAVIP